MNESNQQFSNSNVNASSKSRLALTLFAFFLGYLGVDRFYGGRILLGILKLYFSSVWCSKRWKWKKYFQLVT